VQARVGLATHALEYLLTFELRHHLLPDVAMLRLLAGKTSDAP